MFVPESPKDAIRLQKELAGKVVICPLPANFRFLGASDLGYFSLPAGDRGKDRFCVAVILVFDWPDLNLVDEASHVASVTFPYVPGLLSFREVPAMLEAWRKLCIKPDVFLCDGQGIAHPRGIGLASHLGVILDIPTVGCAKKRLCGTHDELPLQKGSRTPLFFQGRQVGVVYRSRTGVKPLYISPGHRADIDSSVKVVEKCIGKYRIPEPLRQAHRRAADLTRKAKLFRSSEILC
ncbi:MAG: endonuclease V [Deltaproteobacteria bacterium]|nr:endonuclease V [Deltaproteobacteria bacterium]MBW2068587.1 endonuclease V [Deltaproteobacteria bacterium]